MLVTWLLWPNDLKQWLVNYISHSSSRIKFHLRTYYCFKQVFQIICWMLTLLNFTQFSPPFKNRLSQYKWNNLLIDTILGKAWHTVLNCYLFHQILNSILSVTVPFLPEDYKLLLWLFLLLLLYTILPI